MIDTPSLGEGGGISKMSFLRVDFIKVAHARFKIADMGDYFAWVRKIETP